MFSHAPLVPVGSAISSVTLAPNVFTPWLVSSYVPGGSVSSGWDLAGMSPSRHSLKLATREKLAQDLKFHLGVQP